MASDGIAEVRLLFGPGGFMRVNQAGRFDVPASTVDITWLAEDLCRAGIRLRRAVPEPREVTGDVEGDLGEGGRAMWVDGGGDIDIAEVQWAIAAALEQLPIAAIVGVADARQRSANLAVLATMETALEQAGLTKRQISALLRRPRTVLGGRSAQQLFDQVSMPADEAGQVVDLVVERVRSLTGPAGVTAFLEAVSSDPAVSRRAK
jgi:hypothetical protein